MTLTFDLETDARYCPWEDNLPTSFGVAIDVSFSTHRPTPVRRIT